ncbi:MAG: DUF4369 domain-containing protein, partial [Ferruginibacter sp.]
MKPIAIILLLAPAFLNAQTTGKKNAPIKKSVVKTIEAVPASAASKAVDGYLINGYVEGTADGTVLKLLNGNTGVEEAASTIQKGKFSFSGKIVSPDFKVIGVNGQAPFITVFLDNSNVAINVKKDAWETADIRGSASHNDFVNFTNV